MKDDVKIKQIRFYLTKALELFNELNIKEETFEFEDIVKLDDRAIQKILQKINQEDLVMALKGTSDEIQNMFFRNMSGKSSSMLKEDMEFRGPVRKVDVTVAQQKIVCIIEELEDSGEILIEGRFDDSEIVE